MAIYRIQSLNYMTAGKDRVFINMDTTCLNSELSDEVALLDVAAHDSDPALLSVRSSPESVLRIDGPQNTISAIERKIEYNRSLSVLGRTVEIEREMSGNDINDLSSSGGRVVGGVYEIEDVCMKSQQDQIGYDLLKFDPPGLPRQDTYVPQIKSQPIQFCTTGSTSKTYMIMEESEKAADVLQIEQDSSTQSYVMQLSSVDHVTVAYSKRSSGSYAEQVSSDPENATQEIFDNYREIPGIKYATIATFPMHGVKSRYFDGNVYCTQYSGKNQYNSTYSMEMDGPDELSVQRKYEGIMSSGNKIYLKYRDVWKNSDGKVPYQKVEQFIPVNSNDHGKSRHKSQLFSVRIRNTGVQDAQGDVVDRIKKDITNAVFRIAEKVCPAQTQLLDVRFGEDE